MGSRMYDARLGRWIKVDPLFKKQPGWSTYKAFLNNPIIYQDPDGDTEYITIITENKKTGETIIEQKEANRIMTDGVKHVSYGMGSMGSGGSTYSYENYYYDYNTVIIRTVGADDNVAETKSSAIIYSNGVKDKDYVFFGGNDFGDTKIEDWIPEIEDIGGIIVYGSSSDGSGAPAGEAKGKVWGSFDYAAFSEIVGVALVGMATKNENALSPEFSGKKAADLVSKVNDVVSYKAPPENVVVCPTCTSTDSSHIDQLHGVGTYTELKKELDLDNKDSNTTTGTGN